MPREFENLQKSIARSVKAARLKVGLSQEALALEAEIDRTYISQIERGIANPSLAILQRIAHALDADLNVSLRVKS